MSHSGSAHPGDERHDAYAALRHLDFRLFVSGNFLGSLSRSILSVIVGYELYLRTDSALALGLVGLVQIIPNVVLALPAGQYVDRHDHQRIAVSATSLNAAAAAILALLSWLHGPLWIIYACLFLIGIGRVFNSPTQGTLLAVVVPAGEYGNASAWGTSVSQFASVLGPVLGGFAVAALGDEAPVYAATAAMLFTAAFLYGRLHPRPIHKSKEPVTRDSLLAGFRFIADSKVLLAAITLDMVAVLLGGATALLPIFAEDILHVGATGLGVMRASVAIGAILMSFVVAHKGEFRRAGVTLLATVAGFGLATILFGLSSWMPLSLLALFLIGAFDSISVVIRTTLELRFTPDEMRGRVGSIHYLFIGMSNEFGEFESGVAAAIFGATGAVVLGGIGTLLVVPAIALIWPQVPRLREIVALQASTVAAAEGVGDEAGSGSAREPKATPAR
ncbi:MAG: MFS transporter [Thermomicrobiales bacterium]